jgi:hypothetical protein
MVAGDRNLALLHRALLLEYTTLAWNVIGTVIMVAATIEARWLPSRVSASIR